jgi:cytochrome c peroxidase
MKFNILVALIILLLTSCTNSVQKETSFEKVKIELGKKLFYDQRLSYNLTKSCSSCHDPKFAFTDGYKKSIGIYGDLHQRNSKPLFNVADQQYFTAADSTIHTLEQQMNKPLFNEHPPEMGLYNKEKIIIERLEKDTFYTKLFRKAFVNKENKITFVQIKNAISTFIKTIKSYNSKYDAYLLGNKNIFSKDEEAGKLLFFSSKLKCNNCHGGKNFNEPNLIDEFNHKILYFNTGLYNIDGLGSYPSFDIGLKQLTNQQKDMGKYKVPTLRNLIYTAPYYHDGSESSLSSVIEDYNNGGRIITEGLHKGNGILNPLKHNFIKKLSLSVLEKKQLLSFLYTLNDSSVINNPDYLITNTLNK